MGIAINNNIYGAFQKTVVSTEGMSYVNKLFKSIFILLGAAYIPFSRTKSFKPIIDTSKGFQQGLNVVNFLHAADKLILSISAYNNGQPLVFGQRVVTGNDVFRNGCSLGYASVEVLTVVVDKGINSLTFLSDCASTVGNIPFFCFVKEMSVKQILGRAKESFVVAVAVADFYQLGKKIWNGAQRNNNGEPIGLYNAAYWHLVRRDNMLLIASHLTQFWLIFCVAQSSLFTILGVMTATHAIGYAQFFLR